MTIAELHTALGRGELTAVGLVEWYLARIEAHDRGDAGLHAVVTVNPLARQEAAARDEKLAASGDLLGPLHGVPVLVKDQIETAGLRTTFGSSLFEDYVPERDATIVTKLREAGAVILAKTSLCDFGAGWFSFSSVTDHTKNPYAPARDSGGSSAGTAAGVAADFGLVGIGEDTGGSARIPASFNNLFGLRVTTGLISRSGCSPLVHFQDTPAPIGRTVADLATLLDGIVGYDPDDPYTVTALPTRGAGGYSDAVEVEVPLAQWRVGVLETGFGADTDTEAAPVNRVVRAAISRLEELGTSIRPALEIPELGAWIADTSAYLLQSKADLGNFLAERPGAPASSFMEIYESGRFHPSNDLFHGIAGGPDAADGETELLRRRLNQEHFRRFIRNLLALNEIDFLVYPTVQVIPPLREELAANRYETLTFPTNTVIASQAGLPALTLPVGFTEDGLPVGMELLGSPLAEAEMLQFARGWEMAARPRTAPAF